MGHCNLLVKENKKGINKRFVTPDRGEYIEITAKVGKMIL